MKLTKEEQDKLNKQLFDAIDDNDLDALKAAVAAGADINATDFRLPLSGSLKSLSTTNTCSASEEIHEYDCPVLHRTLLKKTCFMQYLLEAGADPNAVNKYGENTLHQASAGGEVELVKLLLKYNADMYAKPNHGVTAFAQVVAQYCESVFFLSEFGSNDLKLKKLPSLPQSQIAELFIMNGYVPTEEDFPSIDNILIEGEGEIIQVVKSYFKEFARKAKVNALNEEEKYGVCCDGMVEL